MTDDAVVPKIRVAFKDLPDEIVAGVHAAPGAAALIFAPPGQPADVEVRARQAVDGHAGWVVAKSRSTTAPLSPDDVIAYADPSPSPFAFGQEQLGPGLVYWARYRAIQTWPGT